MLGFWGPMIDSMGYGALAVSLHAALLEQGVEIEMFHPNQELPRTPVALWVAQPGHSLGHWQGQHAALYTMWESTKLPESYIEAIDQFDTVIVPNTFNNEQFSHFHPNVVTVPLGIDTSVWSPVEREVGDTFDFLICGAGPRKGTDLAWKAFCAAFPFAERMSPQPRLISKNHKDEEPLGTCTIDRKIPLPELVTLYQGAHCYVQPARGEGWGYQPHQALATGMPAILSDIPGHQEYAWVPGAIRVPTKQVKAGYFMYGEAGDWWEPDFDYLVEAYREVYRNYSDHLAEAQKAPRYISDLFSSRAMALGVIDALGGMERLRSEPEYGEFQRRTIRRFLLRVTQRCRPSIGDWIYEFVPGRDYWTYADVKRVLWEAGKVDPSCMEAWAAELGDLSRGKTDAEAIELGLDDGRVSYDP